MRIYGLALMMGVFLLWIGGCTIRDYSRVKMEDGRSVRVVFTHNTGHGYLGYDYDAPVQEPKKILVKDIKSVKKNTFQDRSGKHYGELVMVDGRRQLIEVIDVQDDAVLGRPLEAVEMSKKEARSSRRDRDALLPIGVWAVGLGGLTTLLEWLYAPEGQGVIFGPTAMVFGTASIVYSVHKYSPNPKRWVEPPQTSSSGWKVAPRVFSDGEDSHPGFFVTGRF